MKLIKAADASEVKVKFLFNAQENTPIFHVEGSEFPLCWNRSKDWNLKYIKYEWVHLHSINRAKEKSNKLRNLALYSARCNQHIQASMNIEELMIYGGILADRINKILINRKTLFQSKEWQGIESELQIKKA